ncbi:MAG: T9SS type A sorting domain-containing protein [Ignavibacteria bacterium]|nr:T9SS type A sorting domain-containing protein [Ignavibacteria bacterium]
MKKLKLISIVLFLFLSTVFADNKKEDLYGGKFTRVVGEINPKTKGDWNKFYPLNIGDFWEFIEKDTTTLFGITRRLNFSIAKEIIADTLMPNGIVYKKIKMWNCANSVNREIKYSFQRADSLGKIYTYLNNSDKLLYDLTKNKNETYPSPFENFFWKVLEKYYVVGFSDTLLAIDIALFDSTNIRKYSETIIENFGVVFYQGNLRDDYLNPEGSFWGAVIDGAVYGDMIVLKQEIDWREFYPLRIGNFWKYMGYVGAIPLTISRRVLADTITSDGDKYFKIREIDHTFGYTYYTYDMVDSQGQICRWNLRESKKELIYSLSSCIGDTLASFVTSFVWRMNEKWRNALHIKLFPDINFQTRSFVRDIGLSETTGDLYMIGLVGAIINGVAFGDTTITSVENIIYNPLKSFELFQNYPNPFNSLTTIKFYLPKSADISLQVYNLQGQLLKTILSKNMNEGMHMVFWNGRNDENKELPSGIYFCRLTVNNQQSRIKKLTLLK